MKAIDHILEKRIEGFLRKHNWFLLLVTFVTSAVLYFGIYLCYVGFDNDLYWTVFPAGLLMHSFFVITMHDGAHKAITRSKFDYIIMNFCSGLIILPLYTELFKKYHLLHHANTNTEYDPLWSPWKIKMFNRNKQLYAILQCIPFALNFASIANYKKRGEQKKLNAPKVNWLHVLLSVVVAASIIYIARPSFWFVFGSYCVLTSLGAIRYFGEHMGSIEGKESNTHWFPLGMGIGNHEVHHEFPGYSWLSLTIGLLFRKIDTNPFKSLYGILFIKSYHHY